MARLGRIARGAEGGFGRLAQAIGGRGQAYQQGYDSELALQSKLAQQMAAARAADANADLDTARAGKVRSEQALIDQRPALVNELVAGAAGTDVPMVEAIRRFVTTGQRAQVPMGPETEAGDMGVGSQQFDPEVQSRVAQQLMRLVPLSASGGDINPQQWANALEAYRGMDLGDDVLRGTRTAADVGRAQAAVGAKPLFNADSTGAVLDLFGGGLATDNPMAQGTIKLRNEQAGAQRANAVQSYAAADKSRADAAETRSGGGRAPSGYRWAAGGALEPIPGGPADPTTKGAKQTKPPTEGQAKALMFGSRMAVADEVLREMEAEGKRLPNVAKQAAESVPVIGGALGMGANFFTTDTEQQIEQAQRDFINAVLRRESGAAIATSEFKNAQRQYFPQPGDSAAVIRQKAANRRTAIEGMKAEFGEQSLPEFERIVGEAKAVRQKEKNPRVSSGKVTEGVPQQRNVVVDF